MIKHGPSPAKVGGYNPDSLFYSIRKSAEYRKPVYVPPEMMTAIVAPALFFPGAAPTITFDTPRLVAAAVAALVAGGRKGCRGLWSSDDDAVGIAGFYALAEYH